MSDRTELAEHATGLGVIGLATMGVNAAPLIPLAVLTAWGIDRFRSCSTRRQRITIDTIVRQIEKSGADHRSVGPALALLKENRHKVAIPPTVLADAEKRGNFPATLYDVVFAGVDVPKDDGVEDLLRLVLTAAWQELRKDEEYHKIFVQEGVAALERDLADGFSRIEARLSRIGDDTAATREMAEKLVAREENRAREFGIKEGMLIALARRYAEGNPSDFDAALRGLERALDVAVNEKHRGGLPGNTDDAVNAVIARVDAMNEDGEIDEAARLIAEEEARAEAGLIRLYDKGIAQAVLTRDAEAAAGYEVKKVALEVTDPADHYPAVRTVFLQWCERGRDKGLNFDLEVAISLMRRAAELFKDNRDRLGACLTNLGNALWTLGQRETGTKRLDEAIAAYRAALEERTRDRVPLDWAMTQMNLGNALQTLGNRETGTGRLEEAVTAYRAALEERTRDRVPLDWARTQMNLGTALQTFGTREAGTGRLEEAVTAYRAALEERTRGRVPLDWARTQMNLANALWTLGTRETGTERLEEAVTAYRAALEEFTRDRVPLDWARTQMNLGAALRTLGSRETGTGRLEEAVTAQRAALEEFTRDRVPLDWAMTQMNLAIALATIGTRETGTGRLEEAVTAFRAALEEFTRDRVPLDWANTRGSEGYALLTLAERTGDLARARQARDQFTEAEALLREGGHAPWALTFERQIPEAQALVDRLSGNTA